MSNYLRFYTIAAALQLVSTNHTFSYSFIPPVTKDSVSNSIQHSGTTDGLEMGLCVCYILVKWFYHGDSILQSLHKGEQIRNVD